MTEYKSEQSNRHPMVHGDSSQGTLKIMGKSLPEDAKSFYEPVLNWINDSYDELKAPVVVTLDIEYMNTSSALYIMLILQKLRSVNQEKKVEVKWVYEEDDFEMKQAGEGYKAILGDMLELVEKSVV